MNGSSIREVMKNKEIILASFSVAPQTANVTAIERDKVLMKLGKALNFSVEKLYFCGLCSILIEKHDFYFSVVS